MGATQTSQYTKQVKKRAGLYLQFQYGGMKQSITIKTIPKL